MFLPKLYIIYFRPDKNVRTPSMVVRQPRGFLRPQVPCFPAVMANGESNTPSTQQFLYSFMYSGW